MILEIVLCLSGALLLTGVLLFYLRKPPPPPDVEMGVILPEPEWEHI